MTLNLNSIGLIPALLAVLMAVITCFALMQKFGSPKVQGRFLAIDGLRGYLALCVFLHHSAIWYFYVITGRWSEPPSNLYTHFGQAGVALFFMITGFLFYSKILSAKYRNIDWLRIYVSRFLRLVPLYFIAICALLLIVYILTGFELRESVDKICGEVLKWTIFTVFGAPDINGIEKTTILMAGVTWSLPYEWFFYFMLPMFAIVHKVRVRWIYVAFGALMIVLLLAKGELAYHWRSFVGGIVAAYLLRSERICNALRLDVFSYVAILLLVLLVSIYSSSYGLIQILFLSCVFLIVAAGNSFFGILTCEVSRTLGEVSYGVYLLHGLMLFILFEFVLGVDRVKYFSSLTYWIVIILFTPVIITVAYFLHATVERPALSKTDDLTGWLRGKLNNPFRELPP